jgi:hypothetical protein
MVISKQVYVIRSGNLKPYTFRAELYITPASAGAQATGNGCYHFGHI